MAILSVGPGQQFTRIADAIAASQNGDVIQVQAGTYVNDFAEINTKISIVGVGGMAHLVATESPPNGKAILTTNTDVTIDHLEFSGARVPDGNGAGIRYQGGNLVVTNSYFHDNEMHILGAPVPDGTITIDNSEFSHNTPPDAFTHLIYINPIARLTVTDSYFHDIVGGHAIKTGAVESVIENNRIYDGNSTASYSIDFIAAGVGVVRNNVIDQSPTGTNRSIIHYGGQLPSHPVSSLVVEGNVIQNSGGPGTIVLNHSGVANVTVAGNSLFGITTGIAGPGTMGTNTTLLAPVVLDVSSPFLGAAPPPPPPVEPVPPTPTEPVPPVPVDTKPTDPPPTDGETPPPAVPVDTKPTDPPPVDAAPPPSPPVPTPIPVDVKPTDPEPGSGAPGAPPPAEAPQIARGTSGDDQLAGSEGNDRLLGRRGNDTLQGDAGDDVLDGGAGRDTADYSSSEGALKISLALFGRQDTGGAGFDTLIRIENLIGSAFDDELAGNHRNNDLDGNDGDDRLSGGHGRDELDGGAGDDIIIGGYGRDLLAGGDGADHFVFDSLRDSKRGGQRDIIVDFDPTEADLIDLSGIDAVRKRSGDQAFSWIGDEEFSRIAGELRQRVVDGDTIVEGDVNGDGRADFQIQLLGVYDLHDSNFIL